MSEREVVGKRVRLLLLGDHLYVDSISEEVVEFYHLWFPEENSLCILSQVFIAMRVILSVKDPNIIMLA